MKKESTKQQFVTVSMCFGKTSVGVFHLEKILNTVVWHMFRILEQKEKNLNPANEEKVTIDQFVCTISTEFTETYKNAVEGYLFDVLVKKDKQSYNMSFIIKPLSFQLPASPSELHWETVMDQRIDLRSLHDEKSEK